MADDLPDKVYECVGEVVQLLEGAALLLMKEGNTNCFCGVELNSSRVRLGDPVNFNARLVPQSLRIPEIPYICRGLWREGSRVPSSLFPRNLEPFVREELAEYIKYAGLMKQKIPTEFEKFLGKPDFEVLGSVLAMQGIISTAPAPPPASTRGTARESSSSDSEDEAEERKKKKKKKKEKKEKKSKKSKKKKKKKKKSSSEEEEEEKEEASRKSGQKKKLEEVDVPHHLVLHKLNDMIQELEGQVKPEQRKPQPDVKPEDPKDENVISYPKIGVQYDPKQVNAWSNLRGFQNPAQKSNWLGLTVAPGAVVKQLPLLPPSQQESMEDKNNPENNSEEELSEEDSKTKASIFQDIFGEERPASPEHIEDDIPTQAFVRRKEAERTDVNPKPVLKTNNLSRALQSRLDRRKSSVDEKPKGLVLRSRSNSRDRTRRRRESNNQTPDHSRSNSRRQSIDARTENKVGDERRSRTREFKREKSRSRTRSKERKKKEKKRKASRSRSRERKKKKRKYSDNEESRKKMKRISEEREEEEKKSKSMEKDLSESPRSSHTKKKKEKKKNKGIVQSYSDHSDPDTDHSNLSTSAVKTETDRKYLESDEDEEKVIEKIRRKRAKLLAHLPEEVEMRAPGEDLVGAQGTQDSRGAQGTLDSRGARENMVPITCFQQDPDGLKEVKQYKTVLLTGSTVQDGLYSQIFQLSAALLNQPNKRYFGCCYPEILCNSSSLTSGSKYELMDTLGLKSSKFDVSWEGSLNLTYKHPIHGPTKTNTEKELILGLLNFLQSLEDPVVIFLHYKDALLPTLLAKLNKFKIFDHFSDLVLYCCDMVGLAWSLHLDNLWTGKHYPSLGTIVGSLENSPPLPSVSSSGATELLESVLSKLMQTNHLNMTKVLEMSNKMSLVEYMSVKYSMIQGVKVDQGSSLPDYLEISQSHDAWGTRSRVDLVWTSLESLSKKLKGEKKSNLLLPEKRSTPLPIPEPEALDGEDQVKILKPPAPAIYSSNLGPLANLKLKAKQFKGSEVSEPKWSTKQYNVFLSPTQTILQGNSCALVELRVPALQLRIHQLRGKLVQVEGSTDFTLCEIKNGVSVVEQSDSSLFPFVQVEFRNPSYHPVNLSSENITYPVATLRLEES